MGRGNRAYKSAKRNKEVHRLKKQEEKRLRRLGKLNSDENGDAVPAGEGAQPETEVATEASETETSETDETPDN